MNKLNILQDSSFKNNEKDDEIKEINQCNTELEKVLCKHCGRTSTNGIRCLGICVSDSDY